MEQHYIAWWNVENLFSFKNDPARSEKLERTLGKELNGWTATVLNKKLNQLAKIITQMNGGDGPDILGVCEVENEGVLDKLVSSLSSLGRNYKKIHADTKDRRGIDVAFIYDADYYLCDEAKVFSHFILRRNATRDILQVSFETAHGNQLVMMGNHWPSRSGGALASEPYRIMAAETLAYFHERTREIDGEKQAVLAVGDFNDEPFDRSMVKYALSDRSVRRVTSPQAKNPYLYNLSWRLIGQDTGTHFYGGSFGMLDQMLINRPMLNGDSPFKVSGEVGILKFQEMIKSPGKPKRFSRPSARDFDDEGYSDHFPIAVVVEEAT
jgi:predicted extracellular nuclease